MQQATVNLFADMGVQPATLQAGLVGRDRVDRHAPRRPRRSPRPSVRRPSRPGPPVTITGTATDTGGGRVGGVEVSTDDGSTWHPASGRENVELHVHARRRPGRADDPQPRDRRQREHGRRVRAGDRHGRRRVLPVPLWDDTRARPRRRRQRRHRRSTTASASERRRRHDHRAPLLQGPGEHRHAHRPPVERRRHAARDRRRSPARPASGWQQVALRTPVADHRRHRPTSPRYFSPAGFYPGRPALLRELRRRQPAAARAAGTASTAPNGVYHYGAERLPDDRASTRATTGSTSCSRDRPRHDRAGHHRAHAGAERDERRARLHGDGDQFNEPLDPATITASTFAAARRRRTRSCPRPSRTTPGTHTATLTPDAPLAPSTDVHGDGARRRRRRHRRRTATRSAADVTWTFTTRRAPGRRRARADRSSSSTSTAQPVRPLPRRDPAAPKASTSTASPTSRT